MRLFDYSHQSNVYETTTLKGLCFFSLRDNLSQHLEFRNLQKRTSAEYIKNSTSKGLKGKHLIQNACVSRLVGRAKIITSSDTGPCLSKKMIHFVISVKVRTAFF